MEITFQPEIRIKEKHLYIFVVLLLIIGGVMLASGQGVGNAPDSVLELLESKSPSSWDSEPKGATHSAAEVKTAFGDNVTTVQDAISGMERKMNLIESKLGEEGICTIGVQTCAKRVEKVTRYGRIVKSNEKENCSPKQYFSGGWTDYADSEVPPPSEDLEKYSSYDYQYQYSSDVKTKARAFIDCSVEIDTVFYQWNDGRHCYNNGCDTEHIQSNADKSKTLIYERDSNLNIDLKGRSDVSRPDWLDFINRGEKVKTTPYSSARLVLKQEHHHNPDKLLTAAFSIHDVEVDIGSGDARTRVARVDYGKSWGGNTGKFSREDIGSGSPVPIDGNWHNLAEIDVHGRPTRASYQVKFETDGQKVWMYDRLNLKSGGKSGVWGGITTHRITEK